jgi:hypothetical protein
MQPSLRFSKTEGGRKRQRVEMVARGNGAGPRRPRIITRASPADATPVLNRAARASKADHRLSNFDFISAPPLAETSACPAGSSQKKLHRFAWPRKGLTGTDRTSIGMSIAGRTQKPRPTTVPPAHRCEPAAWAATQSAERYQVSLANDHWCNTKSP